MIIRLVISLSLAFFSFLLGLGMSPVAAKEAITLQSIKIDTSDKEKLQRGAKMFMNYCAGCHSLRYMRYNRMAKDLGLTTFDGDLDKDLLVNNLIFTQVPVHYPIVNSMPAEDARQWFGIVPPDLSLVVRQRGANWVYSYLQSFYEDPSRPFRTNNILIPNVAMPNVLAPLSGRVIAFKDSESKTDVPSLRLLYMGKGQMTESEFKDMVGDIVTFLAYVAEPDKSWHFRIGIFVLMYLCVFLVLTWQLKKIYWKDISP